LIARLPHPIVLAASPPCAAAGIQGASTSFPYCRFSIYHWEIGGLTRKAENSHLEFYALSE
jgi:hypothetical protein